MSTAFKEVADNIKLVFVSNGLELLNHFNYYPGVTPQNLPVLLIVDLNMPKKNGTEAIKELVKMPYFTSFTTAVFSTTGNELEKNKCQSLGIKNFFVKPSSYQELKNMVKKFIMLI